MGLCGGNGGLEGGSREGGEADGGRWKSLMSGGLRFIAFDLIWGLDLRVCVALVVSDDFLFARLLGAVGAGTSDI